MPNEKFQISLSNKRIFLVKIQVMIYFLCIVAVIFGAYYFGDDLVIKFQFFKIYFLFLFATYLMYKFLKSISKKALFKSFYI